MSLVVDDHYNELISPSSKPRKKVRYVTKWKKNIAKRQRYSGEGKTPKLACSHGRGNIRHRGTVCFAGTLTEEDVQSFFAAFHAN